MTSARRLTDSRWSTPTFNCADAAQGGELKFGAFEIRSAERAVYREGEPVQLGARAFDVLLALAERRERVVSKSELMELAWPGLVVEENNLSVQISALRKLLGAQAIATVTGRGYRFTAHVEAAASLPVTDGDEVADTGTARIVRRVAVLACADFRADTVPGATLWPRMRAEYVDRLAAEYGGRVGEAAARRIVIEFRSAVDAVRWALEARTRTRADRGLSGAGLRISLGMDDMIVDDGRLVGDAPHTIAMRLHVLEIGEIVVDDFVRQMVRQRLVAVRFEPQGGAEVLHLLHDEPAAAARSAPVRSMHPGVAVLPLRVDDPTSDGYFGDGVTEEIISALSVNRGLVVTARASTLRYRGVEVDPRQVARELGVRYLLSGTVRRHASRLRIGAELVDAEGGRRIWAEHYDGRDEELFDLQIRIATGIAAAIDPRVQEAEIARALTRPTTNLSAYDEVLRGLALLHTFKGGDFESAANHFRHAITLDPAYARAHAHLAWWHNLCIGEGRSRERDEDATAADRLSRHAVELDPRDAMALAVAGHIRSFLRKDFKTAMEHFDQALTIDPSCALAWARSGTTLAYMGDGEAALGRVQNAMRLSPFDPMAFAFCTTNGTACLVADRADEAVAWYGRALRLNPGYRAAQRMQAAALALSGEVEEARARANEFMQSEPDFRIGQFASTYPLRAPHLGRLLEGLRAAGLPE